MDILFLILGVAVLAVGGEVLIRGSLSAAKFIGISPLLSGIVIIGFGTSSPELAVSVFAAINQQPDIAIGNVVGSNIVNILLILGICALINPLTVKPLALRRDATVVVLSVILYLVLSVGSFISRLDSLILLTALFSYLMWAYHSERSNKIPSAELHKSESEELSKLPKTWITSSLAIIIGFFLLIGGSQLLLSGALGLAETFNISETVIGLTLVAIGTSLPELSVSVIATVRRHADVAVGNILGSNIFNILGILGTSALIQPLTIHARIIEFDQWVMIAVSLVLLLFLYTGRNISRLEGALLLMIYVIYAMVSITFIG